MYWFCVRCYFYEIKSPIISSYRKQSLHYVAFSLQLLKFVGQVRYEMTIYSPTSPAPGREKLYSGTNPTDRSHPPPPPRKISHTHPTKKILVMPIKCEATNFKTNTPHWLKHLTEQSEKGDTWSGRDWEAVAEPTECGRDPGVPAPPPALAPEDGGPLAGCCGCCPATFILSGRLLLLLLLPAGTPPDRPFILGPTLWIKVSKIRSMDVKYGTGIDNDNLILVTITGTLFLAEFNVADQYP